jgi:23S rRNA (pseudouridine1915-N3)-methyltransferase
MLKIVAVGRMKDKRLAALADDYMKRLRPLAPVAVEELKDRDSERESREMVQRLGSADGSQVVVALDERGEMLSSRELAEVLGLHGNVVFLIGGADGLGADARARADRTLSLSRLTFTHEMARVLLLEQIYRGLGILRGLPYHRD